MKAMLSSTSMMLPKAITVSPTVRIAVLLYVLRMPVNGENIILLTLTDMNVRERMNPSSISSQKRFYKRLGE